MFISAQSASTELIVLLPSLKTKIFQLPMVLLKPSLLYGVLGIVGGITGRVVIFIRRQEKQPTSCFCVSNSYSTKLLRFK